MHELKQSRGWDVLLYEQLHSPGAPPALLLHHQPQPEHSHRTPVSDSHQETGIPQVPPAGSVWSLWEPAHPPGRPQGSQEHPLGLQHLIRQVF